MVEAAMPMLTSWENIFGREGGSAEIVVDESLRNFSADVISRTSFGSNFAKRYSTRFGNFRLQWQSKTYLVSPEQRYVK
jgi:hypothetical protein